MKYKDEMDTRYSLEDWRNYFSHCARKKGSSYANGQIDANIGDEVYKIPYFNGMKEAFMQASICESRMLMHVAQALGTRYNLPVDSLFKMGLPQREFIVKCDLSHGRLGDCLYQLSFYIHAMKSLNLVLIVNPYGAESKNVLISSSDEFDTELFVLDMNTPISEYLKTEARSCTFDRRLLFEYSSKLLCAFNKELNQLSELKEKLEDTVVLHIRSGDGLFVGTNMSLPPFAYYMEAIKESGCKKVLVVAEPFYEGKDPFPSPVPSLIASECEKNGVECSIQSNNLLGVDVATLFYANRVVASNSCFSKIIPLYGDSCKSLTIPSSPGSLQEHWMQDKYITYINCWEGFDREEWQESLDYRIAWVSGQVNSH